MSIGWAHADGYNRCMDTEYEILVLRKTVEMLVKKLDWDSGVGGADYGLIAKNIEKQIRKEWDDKFDKEVEDTLKN